MGPPWRWEKGIEMSRGLSKFRELPQNSLQMLLCLHLTNRHRLWYRLRMGRPKRRLYLAVNVSYLASCEWDYNAFSLVSLQGQVKELYTSAKIAITLCSKKMSPG